MNQVIFFFLILKTDMTVKAAQGDNPAIVAPTGLEFQITDTKLYVPVITLSKENDKKLLDQLKLKFKRTKNWTNTDQKWLWNLKITT